MSLPSGTISIQAIFSAYNSVYSPQITGALALSALRGAGFTDGSSVPTSGSIAMSLFRGRTFGSGGGGDSS